MSTATTTERATRSGPVALTFDDELTAPDWDEFREALKAQNADAPTMLEVEEIRTLWENPNEPHLGVVQVRNGKSLVIFDWLGEKSRYDSTIVAKHQRSGALAAAGFDGKDAAGTRKPEFAMWFTPQEIREHLDDSEYFNGSEIPDEILEAAIRKVVYHEDGDWTYEMFSQIRDRICELAIEALASFSGKEVASK